MTNIITNADGTYTITLLTPPRDVTWAMPLPALILAVVAGVALAAAGWWLFAKKRN